MKPYKSLRSFAFTPCLVLAGCSSIVQDVKVSEDICSSNVAVSKFYEALNIEELPVKPITELEISYELSKSMEISYSVTFCRGTDIPLEFYKYTKGSILYGYEYIYDSRNIVELKVLFQNGNPTTYRLLQEI